MKEKRYIVISDTHLGYKAKDLSINRYTKETKMMDEYFQNFLSYYTDSDKYNYELIINGDFIDFIAINYRISIEESDNFKLTLDEIKYGLSSKEKHIVWKLQKIAKIHPLFFQELANFILKGNKLVIIKGNHDIEFYWPKVQKELKNILSKLAKKDISSDIEFKDWFYYKEDLFYIEHGNQYEEFTSFNNFLVPLNPTNLKKLEAPYTHISMRYWINLVKGLETDNLANWTIKDFWKWVKFQGILGLLMQFIYYFRALYISLSYTKIPYLINPFIKIMDKKKLKGIANDSNLSYNTLYRIRNLKYTPVGNSIFNVLKAFYFEWILILNGFLIFIIFSLISKDWILISKIFIFYILFSVFIYFLFSHKRVIAPDKKLVQAAKEISKILDTKYIIFGHTHHPMVEKIDKNNVYLNTGSWLSKNNKKYNRRFHFHLSHVVIDENSQKCSIRNWLIEEKKPIELLEKGILERI